MFTLGDFPEHELALHFINYKISNYTEILTTLDTSVLKDDKKILNHIKKITRILIEFEKAVSKKNDLSIENIEKKFNKPIDEEDKQYLKQLWTKSLRVLNHLSMLEFGEMIPKILGTIGIIMSAGSSYILTGIGSALGIGAVWWDNSSNRVYQEQLRILTLLIEFWRSDKNFKAMYDTLANKHKLFINFNQEHDSAIIERKNDMEALYNFIKQRPQINIGESEFNRNIIARIDKELKTQQTKLNLNDKLEKTTKSDLINLEKTKNEALQYTAFITFIVNQISPDYGKYFSSIATAGINIAYSTVLFSSGQIGPVGLAADIINQLIVVGNTFFDSRAPNEDYKSYYQNYITETLGNLHEKIEKMGHQQTEILHQVMNIAEQISEGNREILSQIKELKNDTFNKIELQKREESKNKLQSNIEQILSLTNNGKNTVFSAEFYSQYLTGIFIYAMQDACSSAFSSYSENSLTSQQISLEISRKGQVDLIYGLLPQMLKISNNTLPNPIEWKIAVHYFLAARVLAPHVKNENYTEQLKRIFQQGKVIKDITLLATKPKLIADTKKEFVNNYHLLIQATIDLFEQYLLSYLHYFNRNLPNEIDINEIWIDENIFFQGFSHPTMYLINTSDHYFDNQGGFIRDFLNQPNSDNYFFVDQLTHGSTLHLFRMDINPINLAIQLGLIRVETGSSIIYNETNNIIRTKIEIIFLAGPFKDLSFRHSYYKYSQGSKSFYDFHFWRNGINEFLGQSQNHEKKSLIPHFIINNQFYKTTFIDFIYLMINIYLQDIRSKLFNNTVINLYDSLKKPWNDLSASLAQKANYLFVFSKIQHLTFLHDVNLNDMEITPFEKIYSERSFYKLLQLAITCGTNEIYSDTIVKERYQFNFKNTITEIKTFLKKNTQIKLNEYFSKPIENIEIIEESNNNKNQNDLYFIDEILQKIRSFSLIYENITELKLSDHEPMDYEDVHQAENAKMFTGRLSNQEVNFRFISIPGNGECGFVSVGKSRQFIVDVLLSCADNPEYRKFLLPEIKEFLLIPTNQVQIQQSSLFSDYKNYQINFRVNDFYKQLNDPYESIRNGALGMLNLYEQGLDIILQSEETYRSYLSLLSNNLWVGHYSLLIYAIISHFKLCIWCQTGNGNHLRLIETNAHLIVDQVDVEEVHILFNGSNHYDRLQKSDSFSPFPTDFKKVHELVEDIADLSEQNYSLLKLANFLIDNPKIKLILLLNNINGAEKIELFDVSYRAKLADISENKLVCLVTNTSFTLSFDHNNEGLISTLKPYFTLTYFLLKGSSTLSIMSSDKCSVTFACDSSETKDALLSILNIPQKLIQTNTISANQEIPNTTRKRSRSPDLFFKENNPKYPKIIRKKDPALDKALFEACKRGKLDEMNNFYNNGATNLLYQDPITKQSLLHAVIRSNISNSSNHQAIYWLIDKLSGLAGFVWQQQAFIEEINVRPVKQWMTPLEYAQGWRKHWQDYVAEKLDRKRKDFCCSNTNPKYLAHFRNNINVCNSTITVFTPISQSAVAKQEWLQYPYIQEILVHSCRKGDFQYVKSLIENHKADPDEQNSYGETIIDVLQQLPDSDAKNEFEIYLAERKSTYVFT